MKNVWCTCQRLAKNCPKLLSSQLFKLCQAQTHDRVDMQSSAGERGAGVMHHPYGDLGLS
jgi:hypothetical protein